MAKYSYEFKKKIVDAYLRGEGGYKYLSSIYGPHKKDIQKWVNNYQSFGDVRANAVGYCVQSLGCVQRL